MQLNRLDHRLLTTFEKYIIIMKYALLLLIFHGLERSRANTDEEDTFTLRRLLNFCLNEKYSELVE